jgi:hypothetical protein
VVSHSAPHGSSQWGGDRPRSSAALRPDPRRRGFRDLGRHHGRARSADDAKTDGGVRRPRRRDHAIGFIGSIAEFHDLDLFRQTIRRSRRFGFIGASVIHPSQVPILNEEFRAGAQELDHARRVVAAYDKALAEGVGAVTVDGRMIDVPVVKRARLLLDREAAIAAREARTQPQR